MFCRSCGKEISPESKFCSKCGAALSAASPAARPLSNKGRVPNWLIVLGAIMAVGVIVRIAAIENGDARQSSVASIPSEAEQRQATLRDWAASSDTELKAAAKSCAEHADWDVQACKAVGEQKIYIGMTAGQVRASWGKPRRVNTTYFTGETHEQWVYGDELGVAEYVYIDNGKVTSLQNEH